MMESWPIAAGCIYGFIAGWKHGVFRGEVAARWYCQIMSVCEVPEHLRGDLVRDYLQRCLPHFQQRLSHYRAERQWIGDPRWWVRVVLWPLTFALSLVKNVAKWYAITTIDLLWNVGFLPGVVTLIFAPIIAIFETLGLIEWPESEREPIHSPENYTRFIRCIRKLEQKGVMTPEDLYLCEDELRSAYSDMDFEEVRRLTKTFRPELLPEAQK